SRPIEVGDKVAEGQVLAVLDDRLARDEVSAREAKVRAAEAELVAAMKTHAEAEKRAERIAQLFKQAAVDEAEVRAAQLTVDRYQQEVVSRREAVNVTRIELRQAQTMLDMHQIRSPARGVLKAIHKQRGEAARHLETVFVIELLAD